MSLERTRLKERMRVYDGLPPEGRALVADFGLNKAVAAYQATGCWLRARGYLISLHGDPVRLRAPSVGSGVEPGGAL